MLGIMRSGDIEPAFPILARRWVLGHHFQEVLARFAFCGEGSLSGTKSTLTVVHNPAVFALAKAQRFNRIIVRPLQGIRVRPKPALHQGGLQLVSIHDAQRLSSAAAARSGAVRCSE